MDVLSTEEAAARLGVKRETLYAYVSRGLVRRRRDPGGRSSFDRDDIERLAARRGGPRTAPVDLTVESSITLVRAGRLYYRGLDAVALCVAHPFEAVAELLWTGNLLHRSPWPSSVVVPEEPATEPLDRLPAIVAGTAEGRDLDAARRLMGALADGLPPLRTGGPPAFAARLWVRLTDRPPTSRLLRALDLALGLAADHGLIPSTLAARVVAAGGGGLAAATSAALGPARAAAAGSHFAAARALLSGQATDLRPLHPDRYPGGDPRTTPLLDALRAAEPTRMRSVDAALEGLGSPPDADVALVALESVARMRPGSAELIALLARTAGWIAHALEEYRRPTGFRARLVYTGPEPEPPPEDRRLLHAVQDYLGRQAP